MIALFTTMAANAFAAEPPAGFVSLFNGKDLSGWQGLAADPNRRAKMLPDALAQAQKAADQRMRAHWTAKDGVLEFDGQGDNLCTAKSYGDFELYVDWKITPAADSGIYLRGTPQVQIWDPTNEAAWQHGADKGSGGLWNNKNHERFPLVKADRPVGQWNTMYIKMIGDRVTVKLNDQLVVDNVVMENYWAPGIPLPATGSIELQNHGNNLWFRNIYIREIAE
jgi:3-keto-disaccharide hydrolase